VFLDWGYPFTSLQEFCAPTVTMPRYMAHANSVTFFMIVFLN
jgi:hypothetical protein